MRHIVDADRRVESIGSKTKHEVQDSKIDNATPEPRDLTTVHRQQLRSEQRNQHSGESEDRARCAHADHTRVDVTSAYRARVQRDAEQVTYRPGQQIGSDNPESAHQRLTQQPQVVKAPHIRGDVNDAGVYERGCDKPPPLMIRQHEQTNVCTPVHELLARWRHRRHPAKHHQEVDPNIDPGQDVSGRRNLPSGAPGRRRRRSRRLLLVSIVGHLARGQNLGLTYASLPLSLVHMT